MIQTLSHTTVYVLDQDSAREFYVEKLGFEVRADLTLGTFRWLTVSPKTQPGLQMILMPLAASPAMDAATADALKKVVQSGAMGCGILETDDCQRTYEELKQQGVKFRTPPTQRPYGLEAVLLDDSGNWFSLVQRPR
jgi:catechol 2,3-dioxygenase-like lactoylglutathione lyase family enzyme